MGWLYVQHYGNWERTLPVVRSGIQKLNAAINHGVGYHETITMVFLRIIDSYWKESCETDWERFNKLTRSFLSAGNPYWQNTIPRPAFFQRKPDSILLNRTGHHFPANIKESFFLLFLLVPAGANRS
jgi:hypothetical protein